jgi:hypothetical protein
MRAAYRAQARPKEQPLPRFLSRLCVTPDEPAASFFLFLFFLVVFLSLVVRVRLRLVVRHATRAAAQARPLPRVMMTSAFLIYFRFLGTILQLPPADVHQIG